MRPFSQKALVCFVLAFWQGVSVCPVAGAEELAKSKPHVLFIAVDDLKPLLGCYGDPFALTPQIDRLASRGTVFLNAHTQQAVCGPSRASLLTGLRPDTTQVWDLKTKIRDILPDVVTLPQHFKNHGYETVGMGKIFDPRSVDGRKKDDAPSWSVPYLNPEENPNVELGFCNPSFVEEVRAKKKSGVNGWDKLKDAVGGMPAVEIDQDVPDNTYDDGIYADLAVQKIGELSKGNKPFFLAVGFKKPHLPFVAPKKYADLYQSSKLPLAEFQKMPAGAPSIGYQPSFELRNGSYRGYTKSPELLPEGKQRELVHGYYACVSYTDAQVGRLMEALEKNGILDQTIIVLWGDHGWHLGDHGMWCKHTNFEQATRVPLIVVRPGAPGGGRCASPVEFLDIFPTLCEIAGLPKSQSLQGVSLAPLLQDPKGRVKEFAVSQYPRRGGEKETMGYTFRDDRYRYTRWVPKNEKTKTEFEELYDYEKDPLETKSFLEDPQYTAILKTMRERADQFLAAGELSSAKPN